MLKMFFASEADRLQDLFANDILCLFVRPQPEEDRLSQLSVVGPLGKLDMGD
jgi:hypothetical protein